MERKYINKIKSHVYVEEQGKLCGPRDRNSEV
jgi:hypothetical protein